MPVETCAVAKRDGPSRNVLNATVVRLQLGCWLKPEYLAEDGARRRDDMKIEIVIDSLRVDRAGQEWHCIRTIGKRKP